jgi:beta-glucosidase
MNSFLNFPKDFIWGAATASYQIEGAAFEDGRTESIWDRFSHTPGKIHNNDSGDITCDHYHRVEQDVSLMREIGLHAYRFSISWSRVLPEGRGKPNQKGLDFYSNLVDTLLQNNINPFVTLFHWDLPMALQDAGGWVNRRICDWFVEYAECMYKTLGDRVSFWSTHNEPNVFALLGYFLGIHAPGVCDLTTCQQVAHHLLLSHGDAVSAGRAMLPKAKFGIVAAIGQDYPASNSPEDSEIVKLMWDQGPRCYLDPIIYGKYPDAVTKEHSFPVILDGDMARISVPIDFIGINHYCSNWFTKGPDGFPKKVQRDYPVTDRNWTVYPDGFRDMLLNFKKFYGKTPVYIMENGASYPDVVSTDGSVHDKERVAYYQGYLRSLHEAIQQGVDVRGYFAWSLLDNFEWEQGYSSRFGIIHVNLSTQERIIKDSGKMFGEVIKENGLESACIE